MLVVFKLYRLHSKTVNFNTYMPFLHWKKYIPASKNIPLSHIKPFYPYAILIVGCDYIIAGTDYIIAGTDFIITVTDYRIIAG